MQLAGSITAFDIPGGWTQRNVQVADRTFRLTLPADPDEFLTESELRAERTGDEADPYWANLWPAALPTARAVLRAEWLRGARALELGAGIGLVGLAGLAAGLDMTISDLNETAVTLAVENARRNGFPRARGQVLDWRAPNLDESFPVILASDIVYYEQLHSALLDAIRSLLEPDGICWIGDPGRERAFKFVRRAKARGFEVTLRDENGSDLDEPRAGQFQLIMLRPN